MNSYFLHLQRYNQWANLRVFESMVAHPVSGECWKLLSHVVLAEEVWLERLRGHSPEISVFQVLEPEIVQEKLGQNDQGWKAFLEHQDVQRTVDYKNLQGEPFTSVVSDILAHIFNHGTYHRAQIALRLRMEGFQPPATDFISFSRIKDQ